MKLSQNEINQIKEYRSHPRFFDIKGYLKENGTGKIYAYDSILYGDNGPYNYSVLMRNGVHILNAKNVTQIDI
ncbi:hypothetical protein [Bacillus altitudinis]|uniref:hypothetical protein n=1 Tax=Bacillus altitudinis TaxID=293387 RepID=UPI00397E79A3